MGWEKREAVSNLVVLGDAPEHKKKAGGLLIGCPVDKTFPDKQNFLIVQKDGEEVLLSGSASLNRQLNEQDIGKFVRCEFSGWGRSANGKFKIINVDVWDGEPSPVMLQWPRYEEFKNGLPKEQAQAPQNAADRHNDKTASGGFEDFPPPDESGAEDDGLGF